MERRLSAILAADMVGYSRLMEADETGTVLRQKAHRSELIDPAIDTHRGRIVKLMGDGMLVEFSSVADAINCARFIQQNMVGREADVPEDKRIRYRIGINLGDVIVDDDDLYGDGVNIAARLEQAAEPGGICVSGTAYDTARSNRDFRFHPLGEVDVKNIERPITAYSVLTGPDAGPEAEDAAGPKGASPVSSGGRYRRMVVALAGLAFVFLAAGLYGYLSGIGGPGPVDKADYSPVAGRNSIAIVPFRTLDPASSDAYIAVGISEDLMTEFAVIPDLLIVGPTTPAAAEADGAGLKKVARELGVSYLLTGSLRRSGDTLRVNARMIDSSSGTNVWAKAFEKTRPEIVTLSREIVEDVISVLPVEFAAGKKTRQPQVHYPDPEAYDLLLRANVVFARFTPDSLPASRVLYEQAIEIDPDYARPIANMAFTYALEVAFGWSDDLARTTRQAEKLIDRALALNPSTHQAYLARGLLYRAQRRYGESVAAFEKAIEIAPNAADGYAMAAMTHTYAGNPNEALEAIEQAIIRNPDHPFFYLYTKGMALFHQDRFADAVAPLKETLSKNPDFVQARLVLAATYAHLGRIGDAEWEYQEVLARISDFSLLKEQARAPYADSNDLLRYMDGLKRAAGES